MADIRPFRGYRPRADLVARIASPPYDVLSSEEARMMCADNDLSFLRVVKAEVDLPRSVDVHADEVYERGAANLRRLIRDGALLREERPSFYVYQQTMGDHVQAGLVAGASIDEYQDGRIKKHEHTRPEKEMDRARHIEVLGANTGPVFLTYRANAGMNDLVDRVRAGDPVYDFKAEDGIGHALWPVGDPTLVSALRTAFGALPGLYVADGHHRSAAASRVRDVMKSRNPGHTGEEPYNFFLSVIFPDDQLQILDYNRVVKDLAGLTEEAFMDRVAASFEVSPTTDPRPRGKGAFGMFLGGRWYRLTAKGGAPAGSDGVAGLDVTVLQDHLLAPILGIEDPRRDARIDFVGGIRGLDELERRCAADAAVAFALYPTRVAELMAVADAGDVMPPKSTWFEPKLRSGIVVKMLEED